MQIRCPLIFSGVLMLATTAPKMLTIRIFSQVAAAAPSMFFTTAAPISSTSGHAVILRRPMTV